MKTYRIPNTDLVVSRIAYGCGHLVGPKELPTAQTIHTINDGIASWKREPLSIESIANASRVIHTAVDGGITLFDHADVYMFGKSEEVFGQVLRQSPGLRNRIVIQTKCGIRFADDFLDQSIHSPHRIDCSRDHIVSCVDGSLGRLGTDRLDILMLHRPDALVEPDEVARAFDELERAGKVRYFGVSNHTAAQIDLLKRSVRQPIVVNQIHLSLLHSYLIADGMEANRDESMRLTHGASAVAGTLDYCRLNGIQVQAWSPLKGGTVADPARLLNVSPGGRRLEQQLASLAREQHVTPSAISLAWLLRHPSGIIPIIGAKQVEHILENCAADSVVLSREEWYSLFASAMDVPSLLLLEMALPQKPS